MCGVDASLRTKLGPGLDFYMMGEHQGARGNVCGEAFTSAVPTCVIVKFRVVKFCVSSLMVSICVRGGR